jgi:hypothetical protein
MRHARVVTQDRPINTVPDDDPGTRVEPESLSQLLGGRRSAVDASVPPVAFGLGWALSGQSIEVAGVAAVGVGAAIAVWRWLRGDRTVAVLVSLLAVLLGAMVALRTGHAADFFLVRLATNAVSAMAWMVSIAARWPLLGLVVGTALGQRTRWRRDPVLLRAYSRASWVWVGQYSVRLAVFIPLWSANEVLALSVAQLVLTWPLVAVCVAASWWVLRRCVPGDHPGIRHPRESG